MHKTLANTPSSPKTSLVFTKTEAHALGSQLCKVTPNGCLTRVGRRGGKEEGTQRCAGQRARPSAQQPLKPVMCFGETLHWNRVREGQGGSETERMSEETEVGQATPISLFPANRCCCEGRGGGEEGGRNEEKNGERSTLGRYRSNPLKPLPLMELGKGNFRSFLSGTALTHFNDPGL